MSVRKIGNLNSTFSGQDQEQQAQARPGAVGRLAPADGAAVGNQPLRARGDLEGGDERESMKVGNAGFSCLRFPLCAFKRNRRASNHRSHLALIPLEKLFSDREDIFVYNAKSSSAYADPSGDPFDNALTDPLVVSLPQRYPGPEDPHWKIPPSEWPTVLRRVEQREPLRKIAREYNVSYETIRRVVRAARKPQAG